MSSGSENSESIPKWRKILYERQPYEDNYVADSFLELLRTNVNKNKIQFGDAVQASGAIVQQLSLVVLFLVVCVYTLQGNLSVSFLLVVDFVCIVLGWRFFVLLKSESSEGQALHSTGYGSFLLVLMWTNMFSPVLRTLTRTISSDTIWALTAILLLCHLFFQDYGFINGNRSRFSAPISLNAAIFSAVLLASQLTSSLYVFGLVSLAVEIFALSPYLRRAIMTESVDLHGYFTLIIVIVTSGLLVPLSRMIVAVYLGTVFGVTFLCPYWLIHIQKYKSSIHGPWDEARLSKPA